MGMGGNVCMNPNNTSRMRMCEDGDEANCPLRASKPLTTKKAEELVDDLVSAVIAYEDLLNFTEEDTEAAYGKQKAAEAALIAALTRGGK